MNTIKVFEITGFRVLFFSSLHCYDHKHPENRSANQAV